MQCGPPRPQSASVEVPHLSHRCGSAPPFPWVWRLAPQSRSPTFPMGVALRHLSLGCGVSPLNRGPPPFPWVWLCATFPLGVAGLAPLSTRQASITGARVLHVRTLSSTNPCIAAGPLRILYTSDTICTLLSIVVLSMAVRAGGRVGSAFEIRVRWTGSSSRVPIPCALTV